MRAGRIWEEYQMARPIVARICPMRAPIRAAIAILMRDLTERHRKRLDWTLLLGWAGIAIALGILILLALR